jgi:hypothetical protein
MSKLKRSVFLLGAVATFVLQPVPAFCEQSLQGIWKETSNADNGSTVIFNNANQDWVGKYTEVGDFQNQFGYRVGDAIIRGRLVKNKFHGEVLIRVPEPLASTCPELRARWLPIQMNLVNRNTLRGAWLQTSIGDDCREYRRHPEIYELTRQ